MKLSAFVQGVPSLSPRQLSLLQNVSPSMDSMAAFVKNTVVTVSNLSDPAAGPLRA
jgi:hypothetical protein